MGGQIDGFMAGGDVSQSGFAASATLPFSWDADVLLELRLAICALVVLGFQSFSSYSNPGPQPEFRDDSVWDEKCVATESRDGLR